MSSTPLPADPRATIDAVRKELQRANKTSPPVSSTPPPPSSSSTPPPTQTQTQTPNPTTPPTRPTSTGPSSGGLADNPDTFSRDHGVDAALSRGAFRDVDLGKTSAMKLVSLLESSLVSASSLERALEFRPKRDDVIVAASPLCGQAFFSKLVRLVWAKDQGEFEREFARDAPVLESRVTDLDHDALRRPQPGRRRVFRTNMTFRVLSEHLDDADSEEWTGPDFVAVFRNPEDVRFQWYEYVRRAYVDSVAPDPLDAEARAQATIDFDARYSSDDLASVPVTQVEPGMDATRADAYEENLAAWIHAKAHPKILVLFVEEFLAQPERVLDRITLFLNERFDPKRKDEILKRMSGSALLDVKWLLTPLQRRMVRFRFAFAGNENPRKDLEELMDRAHNVSSNGIFVSAESASALASPATTPMLAARTRKTPTGGALSPTLPSIHDVHRAISPEAKLRAKACWDRAVAPSFGTRTYEDMYAALVGEPYPVLPQDPRDIHTGGNAPVPNRRTSSFRAALGLVLDLPARAASSVRSSAQDASPRSPASAPVVGSGPGSGFGRSASARRSRAGSKTSVASGASSGMMSPGSGRKLLDRARAESRDDAGSVASSFVSPMLSALVGGSGHHSHHHAHALGNSGRRASSRSVDDTGLDADVVFTSPTGGRKLLEMIGAKNVVQKVELDGVEEVEDDDDDDEDDDHRKRGNRDGDGNASDEEVRSSESVLGDDDAIDADADARYIEKAANAKNQGVTAIKAKTFRF